MFNKVKFVKGEKTVNLHVPFFIVTISNVIVTLPGVFVIFALFGGIQESQFEKIMMMAILVAILFSIIVGNIVWIISSGIYYYLYKILLIYRSEIDFRKFLFITGYLYPIKVISFLIMFFIFLYLGNFFSIDLNNVEKFIISWKLAQERINIISSFLYLLFISIASSTLFESSLKKSSSIIIGSYILWILGIELTKRLIF